MSDYFGQGKYPLKEGQVFDGGLALSWGQWTPQESANDEDTRPRFSTTQDSYTQYVEPPPPPVKFKLTLV